MDSIIPLSKPPTPPRLKSTDLPEPEEVVLTLGRINETQIPFSVDDTNELDEINLSEDFLSDHSFNRPLIDEISPMSVLRAEYENGSRSFVGQIDGLSLKGFTCIRRTRGDGDCFYRSVAFAYVERILDAPDIPVAVATAVSILQSTLPLLEEAGFQKIVYEDFYDIFVSLVENVGKPDENGEKLTPETLLQAFQSPMVSNSVVVFLRLLTSAQIRADPDNYAPFLFHPELGIQMEPRDFCEGFVEAVGKEADHVQIIALSRALLINIDIAYLDGHSPDGKVDFVEFRHAIDCGASPLNLLYRPGHYDILIGPNERPNIRKE